MRELKLGAMKSIKNEACYIGIAVDETERINNSQNVGKLLPLVDNGWTEADCMKWCVKNDLLSPIYKTSVRGGLLVLSKATTKRSQKTTSRTPRIMGADA